MSKNNLLSKFTSSDPVKKTLNEYYSAFLESAGSKEVYDRTKHRGTSLGLNGWVNTSQEMVNCSYQFATQAIKIIGTKFGDENELASLIQTKAHEVNSNNGSAKDFIEQVNQEISGILDKNFEIFLPNYLVSFDGAPQTLKVGTVRIITLSTVATEVQAAFNEWEDFNNFPLNFDCSNNRIISRNSDFSEEYPSAPLMWAITPRASKANVREEAIWQIGVAISLIRLRSDNWGMQYPQFGDLEPNPIVLDYFTKRHALILEGNTLSV